jgi:hypothetical protein
MLRCAQHDNALSIGGEMLRCAQHDNALIELCLKIASHANAHVKR